MDYIPYLPKEPPKDIVNFALEKNLFNDYLIYKCSDSRNGVAECRCSACGRSFEAEWGREQRCTRYLSPYFTLDGVSYKSWDEIKCPLCNEKLIVRHTDNIYGEIISDMARIQVFSKLQELFIISVYRVDQDTFKDAHKTFRVVPYEHYVFEKRKAYTIRCYGCFYSNRYSAEPHQLAKFTPPDYLPYTYPYPKDFIKGTYMENSRLDKYLKKTKTKGNAVQYLRSYQGFNKLDVLMDLPFGRIFVEEIDKMCGYSRNYTSPRAQFKELNRKEKSPYKILGINRGESKIIPWKKIGYKDFVRIKRYKEVGGKLTEENIKALQNVRAYDIDEILASEYAVPAIKYLNLSDKYSWRLLKDYWRMAALLGYDLDNQLIRWPKDLVAKHDDVMKKVVYQKNEKINKEFAVLAEFLQEVSYSNGNICIRAAASVEELKSEGQVLRHCVGGYGEQHCTGKSIFFIREAKSPDVPWYTLQVDLRTGRQIQLHGYHNELDGQTIPQAVYDFTDYWLKNIFRRFDVDTMQFIDKPKAAATA